jgi:hypothetical protein
MESGQILRCSATALLITAFGCAKQPLRKDAEARSGQAKPVVSATASVAKPSAIQAATTAPAVREVPFDGGVAHVETDARGFDHVLLVGADGSHLAESTCVPSHAGYDAVRSFYADVRTAILGDDTEKVAAFMAFPLRVNGKRTRVVSSPEQFVRERARILTPEVVARVRDSDPGQVFCNSQGEMLGDGVLWAEVQANDRLAVWVINLGPESPASRMRSECLRCR